MRIFALGGYGKVGSEALKLLADNDLVSAIAVAGRDQARAAQTAAALGEKATAIAVDGTDEASLQSACAGYDLVLNCAYNDSVLPAIAAAANAGAHYCDANTLIAEPMELSPQVTDAGVCAVVATGFAPCLSNLMAIHAADELDETEQVCLCEALLLDFQHGWNFVPQQLDEPPEKCLENLRVYESFISSILQLTQKRERRPVLSYRDGHWQTSDPVADGMSIPTNEGGAARQHPYAAFAPIFPSLPEGLGRSPTVEVMFSPLPPRASERLRTLAGQVSDGLADAKTAGSEFFETLGGDPKHWLAAERLRAAPVLWVRAVGRKSGRASQCTCAFAHSLWNVSVYLMTSLSLAVAAQKILRGEVHGRGVMTAESAFDPKSFFAEVASLVTVDLPEDRLVDRSLEWLE
jgi:hypothetical protein